jgi:hypothetical protein
MLCSYFVLSFDACIVTITWSLLFVLIALWVICQLSRLLSHLICRVVTDIGVFPYISSADEEAFGFTRGRGVRVKFFSGAPCLARKCGTRKSDNPVRAL